MSSLSSVDRQWAIVLAGGEGSRMQSFINQWQGRYLPKQYCTFVGTRSMLQHTIDRSMRLVSPDRIVTVIGRGHRNYIDPAEYAGLPGRMIEQPEPKGTAPGIFFPLTHILAVDPGATVFIFPSDHYLFSETAFVSAARNLGILAAKVAGRLFLFGAQPDQAETDYGWIEPGESLLSSAGHNARKINAFREKPSREGALRYLQDGYLWNTLIIAVRAHLLWELGHRYLPSMMKLFEDLRRILAAEPLSVERESQLLENMYERMPVANFSQALLEAATPRLAVVPLSNVQWSDWGRPHRIVETLEKLGRTPRFDPQNLPLLRGSSICSRNSAARD